MIEAKDLFPVIAATWPPARSRVLGPFLVPDPDRGGNRVSAARLADATATCATEDEIDTAARAMRAQGRAPLFQVLDHQGDLSRALDARGYGARDETDLLVIETAALAAPPPPVTAFDIWPPLAIQTEIWEAAGIDAARRAVMDRASGPRTAIFGRIADKPAGTAFVAIHAGIAMLHALEVAPAGRRKGLAAHMMRAAADWARARDAPWFSVLVTRRNEGAQRLYASLGMKAVGTYVYREKTGGLTP